MKDNSIEVSSLSEAEAKKMTADNKYGYVWPFGLYIVIDNSRCVLESREECDALIAQLRTAADSLWPQR